jgi:hypothetical protein
MQSLIRLHEKLWHLPLNGTRKRNDVEVMWNTPRRPDSTQPSRSHHEPCPIGRASIGRMHREADWMLQDPGEVP